ncbi:DNA adenine methylase [Fundicoccus ignavus]|uniref:DNA methyltransferase n=1 Tax=Fundicoccus ignavus TaxID=2664442 RepID=A0A844BYP0_9LACT|nr:DNA adenine methylase [Fundicoccus ignavus]MRJ47114.1 hypothetical protein [Fundicoccus ignavus]
MSDIRAIQYLGSKLNLKDTISSTITNLAGKDSVIVDGFAGTGVVGNELKDKFKIISNDIQMYSSLINEVLLDSEMQETAMSLSLSVDIFQSQSYTNNLSVLRGLFKEPCEYEEKVIKEENYYKLALLAESEIFFNNMNFKFQTEDSNYSEINQVYSSVMYLFTDEQIRELRKENGVSMLFTLYYLNGYFSLSQCIEIDSIRRAIEVIPNIKEKKLALFLLLHAVSEATCAVGKQFAQPIRLLGSDGKVKRAASKRTFRDWNVSIRSKMEQMLERLLNETKIAKYENEVYNKDFFDLVEIFSGGDNLIYYLDPPYTIDHYSRFYHVLETLILYDYPDLEVGKLGGHYRLLRGRYRNDRTQSKYSIPSKARFEFEKVFKKISETGASLVLSYSEASGEGRARLITKEELIDLLEENFDTVESYEINHSYRRLNKEELNFSSALTRELLFYGVNNG